MTLDNSDEVDVHLIEDLQVIGTEGDARRDQRRLTDAGKACHALDGTRHARAYRAPSRPAPDHRAIKQDERAR